MAKELTGLSESVLVGLMGRELDLVEKHGLSELLAELTETQPDYVWSVGVYANDSMKDNYVDVSHLATHIAYNLSYRPGRAFFVNFHCLNHGYLGAQRADEWKEKLQRKGMPEMKRATTPYQ